MYARAEGAPADDTSCTVERQVHNDVDEDEQDNSCLFHDDWSGGGEEEEIRMTDDTAEQQEQEEADKKNEIIMLKYGTFELLETLPHDTSAFTQGLSFFNGYLYQGTGLHGSSSIQKLNVQNPSHVLQSYELPSKYFGEGITYYRNKSGRDRMIQLTWRERTAIVYSVDDENVMNPLFRFQYHVTTSNGEGWGITFDAQRNEFIVSDGSDQLFFWDALLLDECEGMESVGRSGDSSSSSSDGDVVMCDSLTMEAERSIHVRAWVEGSSVGPIPVSYLNELELIPNGTQQGTGHLSLAATSTRRSSSSVLANVWFQNYILEIDLDSGNVMKLYDFSALCPQRSARGENVLNGISISGDSHQENIIFITGKKWSKLYKVKLL